mmetsp:Transcript_4619/g.6537  ORF Transcript_4619/g.6537 Transcript_4619/m.6537 type:complete len:359 (-) Transcript_4619:257-1333(-)
MRRMYIGDLWIHVTMRVISSLGALCQAKKNVGNGLQRLLRESQIRLAPVRSSTIPSGDCNIGVRGGKSIGRNAVCNNGGSRRGDGDTIFTKHRHLRAQHFTKATEATDLDLTEGFDDMTGNERFDRAWLKLFRKKDRIRCPFWRRRAADSLETLLAAGRFILARHKRLDVQPVMSSGSKVYGLSIEQIKSVIEEDYNKRNYYVTGRLSRKVYADNCFFNSPDPDTPVTGLRKYVDAISHLFEHNSSTVDLLHLQVIDSNSILAKWRLEGTLMLPWRPKFKAYTGCTLYTIDDRGLVIRHEEAWSISAFDAFVSTIFPDWPFAAKEVGSAQTLLTQEDLGVPRELVASLIKKTPVQSPM